MVAVLLVLPACGAHQRAGAPEPEPAATASAPTTSPDPKADADPDAAPQPAEPSPLRPARHRGHPTELARHPGAAAPGQRLRRDPADTARARPPPVHAARHAACAARHRVRLAGDHARSRLRHRALDLEAGLPGGRHRPVLDPAHLRRLRRPAAHRRAAGEPVGRRRPGHRVPPAVRREVPHRGDADHPRRRAGRTSDRGREQHGGLQLQVRSGRDVVLPARLWPRGRREPVPEPLHQGRPGAAGARVGVPGAGMGAARA